jgi:hypothetical protein
MSTALKFVLKKFKNQKICQTQLKSLPRAKNKISRRNCAVFIFKEQPILTLFFATYLIKFLMLFFKQAKKQN